MVAGAVVCAEPQVKAAVRAAHLGELHRIGSDAEAGGRRRRDRRRRRAGKAQRSVRVVLDQEGLLPAEHLREAGLSQRVTLIRGDAHREVARLPGPFDFVFLDADKEGQVDYFNQLYPRKLVPGGMLAVHNAIHQAGSMRDYLDMIRTHPDFDTVTLSATLDDGFCLGYRHRAS
jgi:hypothetical protein